MTTSPGKVVRPTPAPRDRSTRPRPDEPQVPDRPPSPSEDAGAPNQPNEPDAPNRRKEPGAPNQRNEPDAPNRRNEPEAPAAVPFEAADAVPRALQIVGSIVAPTTLVTGLFFYFGLLYAVAYYRYFGVNYTVLDLPGQGFLILSASTATLPLALLAGSALLALWLYQVPFEELSGRARRLLYRGLLPAVAIVGVGLLSLVAADALFATRLFPAGFWEARGLSLAIGVVLLTYAARLRRVLAPPGPAGHADRSAPVPLTVAKWTCVSVLLGVGLFWAVGSYAIRMGTEGAQGHAAGLWCAPDVVLYSEKSLNLQFAGVREEPVPGPDGAYGFRYPGLKLVPQAGKQYLLLPADWAQSARPAILLPRSDTLRLEFITVATTGPGAC